MKYVIIVIVALVILSGIIKACSDPEKASESDYQAFFQQNIKKKLRDPQSASYRWEDCYTSSDGKTFSGKCFVRSTNAFGAYVVDEFDVTGKVENGNIHIEWRHRR